MTFATQLFPSERQKLYESFRVKLETAYKLDRKLVSFQANKSQPFYRWFKYKEGFSSALVRNFLKEYTLKPGKLLDPFAGAGTSLFVGKELGWKAHGIELLPVGAFAIETREALLNIEPNELLDVAYSLLANLGSIPVNGNRFQHLTITRGAFPELTEDALNRYLSRCNEIQNESLKNILQFAALTVLEEISFTRKDGQYLRWDHRSNRSLGGKQFDKGKIYSFEEAIKNKLDEIIEDLVPAHSLLPFDASSPLSDETGSIEYKTGSCLELLPKYESEEFDFVITSPPYCNRYDYTRTYALELAFLGYDDEAVRKLRQSMLSCTVENKEKLEQLKRLYISLNQEAVFGRVLDTYEQCEAMSEVNITLEKLKSLDRLNNKNIARMVRNYFLEMCFAIYELARVTKPGGYCVMVNDNVRYGGEEIPADLILSDFARSFGYSVEKIFVLPRGKGNSSQQMGNFGRAEIRKCVYLWRKT